MIANFGHCEERSNRIYKISFTSHFSEIGSFLAMTNWMEKLEQKTSFYPEYPSPDGRENPFVSGFGTKDWKEHQDKSDSD